MAKHLISTDLERVESSIENLSNEIAGKADELHGHDRLQINEYLTIRDREDDSDFEVRKDSGTGNLVITHNAYDPQGNVVKTDKPIVLSSDFETMQISRNLQVNGDLVLTDKLEVSENNTEIKNRLVVDGSVKFNNYADVEGLTVWGDLLATRGMTVNDADITMNYGYLKVNGYSDNHHVYTSMSVGDVNSDSYLQLDYEKSNPYNNYKDSILFNDKNLMTSSNGTVDLGSETNQFKDGYFSEKIKAGEGIEFASGLTLTNDGEAYTKFVDPAGTHFMSLGKGGTDKKDIVFKTFDGNIYLMPNKPSTGTTSVVFGDVNKGIEAHLGTSTWRLCPMGENSVYLGYPSTNGRWSQCYLKASVNVASDKNLKENIVYLNDKEVVKRADVITTDDMYNFVKDELKLTRYNLKNKSEMADDNKDIVGFIAQDVKENSKIGSIVITEGEDGVLGYDTGSYTNVLAGALQVALKKIEELENKVAALEAK